jgi:hypothetical protein
MLTFRMLNAFRICVRVGKKFVKPAAAMRAIDATRSARDSEPQISYFVARFAGPSVRFVKPTKNYLVAAGERKQHLIEHGDSHGDSPQTDDRQNLGGGLDRLPVLDLASFHSCAYQVT